MAIALLRLVQLPLELLLLPPLLQIVLLRLSLASRRPCAPRGCVLAQQRVERCSGPVDGAATRSRASAFPLQRRVRRCQRTAGRVWRPGIQQPRVRARSFRPDVACGRLLSLPRRRLLAGGVRGQLQRSPCVLKFHATHHVPRVGGGGVDGGSQRSASSLALLPQCARQTWRRLPHTHGGGGASFASHAEQARGTPDLCRRARTHTIARLLYILPPTCGDTEVARGCQVRRRPSPCAGTELGEDLQAPHALRGDLISGGGGRVRTSTVGCHPARESPAGPAMRSPLLQRSRLPALAW